MVSVCETRRMGTTPRAGNAERAACSMRAGVRCRKFGMVTHLPALFRLVGLTAGARCGGRASRRRRVLLAGVRTRGGVGHHRRGLGELPSLRAGRHRAEGVPLRRCQHAARLLGAHVRVHALCEAVYGDLRGGGVREFERTPRRAMCAGLDAARRKTARKARCGVATHPHEAKKAALRRGAQPTTVCRRGWTSVTTTRARGVPRVQWGGTCKTDRGGAVDFNIGRAEGWHSGPWVVTPEIASTRGPG